MVETWILGIDDAGRGPVIGPMVLAGCLIDKKLEPKFRRLGVRDSKQLTQKRREFLEKKIKDEAETFEIVISKPLEIDKKNEQGINLNELEAIGAARIINRINKGYIKIKVVIDCPSVSIFKWQDLLKTKIKNLSNLEISCEHKADKNHVSVAAASILAKCAREKAMAKLKAEFGDAIGSGYTSDPATQKFLQKNARKHKDKGIFRKSWVTWKKAHENTVQKKLI
ncbi:ribonuclease HII [Nanoarchaeota archaeon]